MLVLVEKQGDFKKYSWQRTDPIKPAASQVHLDHDPANK